jgi:hypothetical protein
MPAFGVRWAFLYCSIVTVSMAMPFSWSWTGLPKAIYALESWFAGRLSDVGLSPTDAGGGIRALIFRLTVATIGAAIWCLVDRRRKRDALIREVFFVTTRYALFGMLLDYGLSQKLGAAWAIGPMEIARPFGETADFTFIWLGYSLTFIAFAGIAELSGGVLMLFRRTTTLGALLIIGSLGTVFLLTLAPWGVSGAMTSGQYVIMAACLAAFGIPRLYCALVKDQPTTPEQLESPVLNGERWQQARLTLKIILVLSILAPRVEKIARHWRADHYESPLAGIYEVESFTRSTPALLNGDAGQRWRLVAIDDYFQLMMIRTIDDSSTDFDVVPRYTPARFKEMATITSRDTGSFGLKARSLTPPITMADTSILAVQYRRLDDNHLLLTATTGHGVIEARLARVSMRRYPAVNPDWPTPWKP